MKKLYRVEVTGIAYVLAEDEHEAQSVARWNQSDIEFDRYASEVDSTTTITADEWEEAIPFVEGESEYGDLTTLQVLEQIQSTCSVRDCGNTVVPEGGDVCAEHVGNEAP